ncbi:MAG: acetylornithine deacetylase [Xanthomonadales bacterium]|nr:acetylornithine deacetylase [Xanthomonadales bacterium]
MSTNKILDHLSALVAIDTTNPPRLIPADGELTQYLREQLVGFEIEIVDYADGHVSIFACRGNADVLFNVHLDTVPVTLGWQTSPFKLDIRDKCAYGRGSCDIKGAAAVLLALAENTDKPMALLFTTDEEGAGGCCVRNFLQSGRAEAFKQVVVAEPTMMQATFSHRGYLSVFCDFIGEGGHSSSARTLKDSSIHRMGAWLGAAIDIAEDACANEEDPGVCFNVGRVEGGEKNNMIAEKVSLSWSARVPPGSSSEALYQQMVTAAAELPVNWRVSMMAPPLPAAGQNDIQALSFATKNQLKMGPAVDFWTEASLFSEHGLPALVLGPGDIAQAHTVDEWVSVEQLQICYDTYLGIISNDN